MGFVGPKKTEEEYPFVNGHPIRLFIDPFFNLCILKLKFRILIAVYYKIYRFL